MYEFNSRVRYSEVDDKGILSYSALVNYLQDCSTFQSEDLGVGVGYLFSMGMAWVINNWQIELYKLPKLGDYITIGTIPYEIRGFLGHRNFYIKDTKTGEFLVKANSLWTLIDLNKVRPIKATPEMIAGYTLGEKLEMEYLDRKIILEGEAHENEPVTITKHMLDTNQHVNNQQYIELALNYIPTDAVIKRLRTEYRESAYLGDVLVPTVTKTNDKIGVSWIKQGSNSPAVICEFTI